MTTAPISTWLPGGDRLRQAPVAELFALAGALREGHFALASGLHSARYLEKFAVLQYPTLAAELCRRFAERLAAYAPDVVVGPTTGGVLLAFETARQLSERDGREVRGIFAEPVPGNDRGRALRRGFEVDREERIVLVDDILTTGTSLAETVAAVRRAGGDPLVAAVIADRSEAGVDVGAPVVALGRLELAAWAAEGCPMCADGSPLERPGSSSSSS